MGRFSFLDGPLLKWDSAPPYPVIIVDRSTATSYHPNTWHGIFVHFIWKPFQDYVWEPLEAFAWHPWSYTLWLIPHVIRKIFALPPLIQLLLASWVIYQLVRLVNFIRADYLAYLDLGKGGTPSNWWGWWRIKRLNFTGGLRDVLEPPHVPPFLEPYRGHIWNLPQREGTRPIVGGVAPQRQIDQKTPVSTFDWLMTMVTEFAAENPEVLYVEKSFLEGHTTALKAVKTEFTDRHSTTAEFGYEICHPHKNDGSLHMLFHPEDVKTVIEAGWGERHPLANASWYWLFYYHSICGKRPPVPETLVFVYAPRNAEEFQIVKTLLKAAAWSVTGVNFDENKKGK